MGQRPRRITVAIRLAASAGNCAADARLRDCARFFSVLRVGNATSFANVEELPVFSRLEPAGHAPNLQ
jgi:hypothetical protein